MPPLQFLEQFGYVFGLSLASEQLVLVDQIQDELGFTHFTYDEVYRLVPVFGGVLKVHQNRIGAITGANGNFFRVPNDLAIVPAIGPIEAAEIAIAAFGGQDVPRVLRNELIIVDPGWYGNPPRGAHLAYHLVLAAPPGRCETLFVEAQTGAVLDRFEMPSVTCVLPLHPEAAGTVRVHEGLGATTAEDCVVPTRLASEVPTPTSTPPVTVVTPLPTPTPSATPVPLIPTPTATIPSPSVTGGSAGPDDDGCTVASPGSASAATWLLVGWALLLWHKRPKNREDLSRHPASSAKPRSRCRPDNLC